MSDSTIRLSRKQVQEVDHVAVQKFLMPSVLLMENAARGAAEVAWEMIGRVPESLVYVVCGGGNNGGDGLAIARHLHNRGAYVTVILASEGFNFRDDALINWRTVRAMCLDCLPARKAKGMFENCNADLIVDALIGTGLSEAPRPDAAEIIDMINATGRPVLAVDLPSGLDCDTGLPLGASCVKATKTVTFVAEKLGFAQAESRTYTGEVSVVDIGCPRDALAMVVGGA